MLAVSTGGRPVSWHCTASHTGRCSRKLSRGRHGNREWALSGGAEAAGRTTCTGCGGHVALWRLHGARADGGSGKQRGSAVKTRWKIPRSESQHGATCKDFSVFACSLSPESGKRAIIKSANNSIFNKRRRYRVEEQAGDATVEIWCFARLGWKRQDEPLDDLIHFEYSHIHTRTCIQAHSSHS